MLGNGQTQGQRNEAADQQRLKILRGKIFQSDRAAFTNRQSLIKSYSRGQMHPAWQS